MRTQRAAGLGQPSTTRSPTFGSLQRILEENEHRREELDLGRVRRAEGADSCVAAVLGWQGADRSTGVL